MNSTVGSNTCVYIGSSARDYEALLLRDSESPAKYLGTGIGTSLLANRISWFFDFRGPSIALDTACSSSLSALHLACQSVRNHESVLVNKPRAGFERVSGSIETLIFKALSWWLQLDTCARCLDGTLVEHGFLLTGRTLLYV